MERWLRDGAEHSIMQTITIAVSAILISVGLTTIPNLFENANDANAKVDISYLSLAEEFVLADSGKYLSGFDPDVKGSLINEYGVRVLASEGVTGHAIVVCDSPVSYLIKATSASGSTFYKSSYSSLITSKVDHIQIPPCVAPEFYDDEDPEEIPVGTPEEENPTEPGEPNEEPSIPGYDDTSPLITIYPSTANVTYTVEPNSYNVLQIKLNNVNLSNDSSVKEDWEIRINKFAYPLNRFNSVDSISAEDSRVSCEDKGNYFSCFNVQHGEWGNGIGAGNSFTLGIVVNATLNWVDNVDVSYAPVSGGAWYATQNITVSTDYPVYGYWKTRINLADLKSLGSSATNICINDSNVTITKDYDDWYWVEGNSNYFVIKKDSPRTFTAARSSSNDGSCVV